MFETEWKDSEVVETWQRFVQGLLGVLALIGAGAMAHYYAPPETASLAQQVQQLSQQVKDLERQEAFAPATVDDARESVAYIYGIYRISGDPGSAPINARVSGTGFIVADGLLATNRHVAEPWYGDREAAIALRHGATPVVRGALGLDAAVPGRSRGAASRRRRRRRAAAQGPSLASHHRATPAGWQMLRHAWASPSVSWPIRWE